MDRAHRLLIAQNFDRLHESLKLIHAQEHSRRNAIARNGYNLPFVLHPPDQAQQLILSLTGRNKLINLRHGNLLLAFLLALLTAVIVTCTSPSKQAPNSVSSR